MSKLHVETVLATLHHETTHTLICLERTHGRYYVTKGDLDCLLWRSVGEVEEGNSVELKLDYEEVLPLIDLIDTLCNGAREDEQQMLEARIQFSAWSPGCAFLNLNTIKLDLQ